MKSRRSLQTCKTQTGAGADADFPSAFPAMTEGGVTLS